MRATFDKPRYPDEMYVDRSHVFGSLVAPREGACASQASRRRGWAKYRVLSK